MALNLNNKNGDNTPITYNLYTDTYDFSDLLKRIDSGINSLISSLKYGDKYADEFRDAVYNIVSGIGDGTITFNNGKFVDSKGRYTNNKNDKKDVYGWAANYVYNLMLKTKKYNSSENNTETQQSNGTLLFLRSVFNSDTPNYEYFANLDEYNPKTGIRDTTQRALVLRDFITNQLLKGNQDESYQKNVLDALQSLDDGLQSRDYLALSRILPGIDFNKLFFTGEHYTSPQQLELSSEELQRLALKRFYDYIALLHPLYEGDLSSLTLSSTVPDSYKDLLDLLITFNKDLLLLVNIDDLPDPLKKPYINLLISQGLATLSLPDGLYIIPNSQLDESVLTYNPSNLKLARKRTHELSNYRQLWINDYIKEQGTPSDQLSQYFTEFKKLGGVLKALSGIKFSNNADYNTGVFLKNLDYILQGLKNNSNYYKWLNDMLSRHASLYNNAGENWLNVAYNNAAVGEYLNLYKSGYNNEFGDNTIGYNSLGITNAINLNMFDRSGSVRTSGDWNDRSFKTDNYYSAITDWRRLLGRLGDFNDTLLAEIVLKFKDAGYDYYLDSDNYYKLRPLNETAQQRDRISDARLDSPLPITVGSELPLPEIKVPDYNNNSSTIYPKVTKKSNQINWGQITEELAPTLLASSRLFASLRTNNRVARTLDRSFNPVLKDTYERYSPITGAFGEMSFRNSLAADLRRLVSRPFTSDASLQLAGLLDANRLARDLEYLGFLADNNEIRRTREAALARQEDNMARRSDVANFNRASINQTNREKAQLEATRLRRNWQSVDNFMLDIESRLRSGIENRRATKINTSAQLSQSQYLNAITLLNQQYKDLHPNSTMELMLNDSWYIDRVNRLKNRYLYELYNISQGKYINNPYSTIPDTYESILSSKNGGKLNSKIITMINKIIKNETYT